jgi:hypothetical protein
MSELLQDDRTLPIAFAGKLDPNYFCRGWNGKREKYCAARAGAGTDHPGRGRCRHHEGRGIVHGRYSTVRNERVGELLDHFQAQTPAEALNPFPELALARALLYDWVDRFESFSEALLAWHESFHTGEHTPKPKKVLDITTLNALLDTISKMIARVHTSASINSMPRRRFLDIMTEIGRAMNEEVSQPKELEALRERIRAIRI